MTLEEIRQLKSYYDIPQLITEEMLTIRNCEEQMSAVVLSSAPISGMPSGHGKPSDMTANMALANTTVEFDKEIRLCSQRIAYYRDLQSRIRNFINQLDPIDLKIITLKFLGPSDPRKRQRWRTPNWDVIAKQLDYSESHVRHRVKAIIKQYDLKDSRK